MKWCCYGLLCRAVGVAVVAVVAVARAVAAVAVAGAVAVVAVAGVVAVVAAGVVAVVAVVGVVAVVAVAGIVEVTVVVIWYWTAELAMRCMGLRNPKIHHQCSELGSLPVFQSWNHVTLPENLIISRLMNHAL